MTHRILMPDLGQTVAEGKIIRWLMKPGDRVAKGEALVEVETDKVTMEVESYREGYLRQFLVNEGEMAGAMTPIAILTDTPDEACSDEETKGKEQTRVAAPRAGHDTSAVMAAGSHDIRVSQGDAAATPAARLRARELGVSLGETPGSGPDGLITRRDVERLAGDPGASTPASLMAVITAKSLQTIPHFYVTVDAEVCGLVRWREQWNRTHPQLRGSINDIMVRLASQALGDVPALNVRYHEGRLDRLAAADVLLVVAVESGLRLMPLADPSGLSWEEFLPRTKEVQQQAKQGRMVQLPGNRAPALAISNLGMFDVKQFTAVIPPGSTAVLAIGAVREAPVVKDGRIEIGRLCTLTLAADHRVVDGITAARFLQQLQARLNSL